MLCKLLAEGPSARGNVANVQPALWMGTWLWCQCTTSIMNGYLALVPLCNQHYEWVCEAHSRHWHAIGWNAGRGQKQQLCWQDTGSVIRVHASSALQPDVVSVFEAEQLVLAPGDWVPDALKLFGLDLNVQ
eukprot:scaffold163448_cov24-Tisochrysis_lutea.AAC.2